jgi:hypothetical protein
MSKLIADTFAEEYELMVTKLGDSPTDDRLVAALVAEHSWTEEGAYAIVLLAREYGTSILRNALMLASALDIEDGSRGF